jgi:hypothetical protein
VVGYTVFTFHGGGPDITLRVDYDPLHRDPFYTGTETAQGTRPDFAADLGSVIAKGSLSANTNNFAIAPP